MPKRSSKFTDSNLKLYYGNLLSHYKECINQSSTSDVHTVYRELFLATQYTVDSPQGSLYHLEKGEKEKVYAAFHTIFYALPLFHRLSSDKKRHFNPLRPLYYPPIIPQYIYNCSDPNLFNWVTLNRNLNPYLPYLRKDNAQDQLLVNVNKTNGMIAGLVILALVFSVAVLTIMAWYYLVHQFLNSMERLWYNEGWLRAVLMSAAAITLSSVATSLTVFFAYTPIIALAFITSLNPITVLITSTVIIASISASAGAFLMNSLHDFIEQKSHHQAIDTTDPFRFRLTADEEEALVEKHIDPMKVRCALVALRVEMNQVLKKENHVPSFLSRHFGSSKSKESHALLQKVRALRRGDTTEIVVGDLKFDCRLYASIVDNTVKLNAYPLLNNECGTVEYGRPIPPILSA